MIGISCSNSSAFVSPYWQWQWQWQWQCLTGGLMKPSSPIALGERKNRGTKKRQTPLIAYSYLSHRIEICFEFRETEERARRGERDMGSKKRRRGSRGEDGHNPLAASLMEGKKGSRNPHFFKILLGDFQNRLKIPPTFLKNLSDESSDQAILRLPDGKASWSVSLDRTSNGTFLSSGWQNFIMDCALNEYELLVFCYEGSMQFTVLLFDKSACQKNAMMPMRADGDSKCRRRRNEKNIPIKVEGKHVKIDVEDLVGHGAEDNVATSVAPNPMKKKKKRLWKQHNSEAEKAATSFCSKFPYFVKRLVECNVSKSFTIRVPAKFSREYLPSQRGKLVLQDPTGRAWTVVCIPGTTCMISGGWTAFARANDLEVGDFCAFEKVGPAELRVTIFAIKRNARME